MESRQLVAVFFICLLLGHEARRAEVLSRVARAARERSTGVALDAVVGLDAYSPDPDYEACAGNSFECSRPGCHRYYIWLDTPEESCRLTEEHKLDTDPVFFTNIEVERLVQTSKEFRKTGCVIGPLSGGYDMNVYKCMRRMQQIIQRLKFITKVQTTALGDRNHLAYEYVNSNVFKDSMKSVSKNIAGGFAKCETTRGRGLNYDKSWQELVNMQSLTELLDKEAGPELEAFEAEKKSEEAAYIIGAMLQMVNVNASERQRTQILSAAYEQQLSRTQPLHEAVQMLEEDISASMLGGAIDKEALSILDSRVLENLRRELPPNPFAMFKLSSNSSALKFTFKFGLGWVVLSVAWLTLFLTGIIFGIIRSGIVFPLLFANCVLLKSVKWVRMGYTWKGESIRGLTSIGRCTAKMWEAIGLDSGEVAAASARDLREITKINK